MLCFGPSLNYLCQLIPALPSLQSVVNELGLLLFSSLLFLAWIKPLSAANCGTILTGNASHTLCQVSASVRTIACLATAWRTLLWQHWLSKSSCWRLIRPFFWSCQTAQELWAHVTQQWGRLGSFPTAMWKSMVCTGTLHRVCFPVAQQAFALLKAQRRKVSPAFHLLICDLAYEVADRSWMIAVTTAMRFLWFSRNSLVHDPVQYAPGTLIARFDSFLHVRLRIDKEAYTKAASGLELFARRILVEAIVLQITSPVAILASQPLRYANWFIMFFDGGSRSYPGPGGAGSCIVSFTNNKPTLLWAEATYLPQTTTTNNFAELTAAECGLRKLRFFNPQVCTVIGDSNMFITLFSRHKKNKADHLVDLYMRAQRSANVLPIREWRHHLPAHNTMADALANFAMDTKATITLWPSSDQYMPSPFRLLLTKAQTFWVRM